MSILAVFINNNTMTTENELTCEVGPPCSLVLADGTVFQGRSFGACLAAEGEVGKLFMSQSNKITRGKSTEEES